MNCVRSRSCFVYNFFVYVNRNEVFAISPLDSSTIRTIECSTLGLTVGGLPRFVGTTGGWYNYKNGIVSPGLYIYNDITPGNSLTPNRPVNEERNLPYDGDNIIIPRCDYYTGSYYCSLLGNNTVKRAQR